jgi:hypothetical protein
MLCWVNQKKSACCERGSLINELVLAATFCWCVGSKKNIDKAARREEDLVLSITRILDYRDTHGYFLSLSLKIERNSKIPILDQQICSFVI